MQTILAYGTRVQLTGIDYDGLNGREPEVFPRKEEVGQVGLVVGNEVEQLNEELQFLGRKENALGGTEYTDEDLVLYKVQFPSGNVRLVASYEIEAFS